MFFKKMQNNTIKKRLDNILVCLGNKTNTSNDIATLPFVDDLVIYFVEETNHGVFKTITIKDLEKLNLPPEKLLEIAKENFKKKIFSIYQVIPLQENTQDEVIIPFDADVIVEKGMYNFWTSLVLFDEFMSKASPHSLVKKWNKCYLAMPYRTLLIIGNAESEHAQAEILRLVNDYKSTDKKELLASGDFEAANRSISNNIYLLQDGKLKTAIINN